MLLRLLLLLTMNQLGKIALVRGNRYNSSPTSREFRTHLNLLHESLDLVDHLVPVGLVDIRAEADLPATLRLGLGHGCHTEHVDALLSLGLLRPSYCLKQGSAESPAAI